MKLVDFTNLERQRSRTVLESQKTDATDLLNK